MKKICTVVLSTLLLSSNAQAGFFGDVLAGMTANALSGKDSSGRVVDKEKAEAQKVQAVLKVMGYFSSDKLDADLNSFDSRIAIKKWQDSKDTGFFGFFKDEATGILSEEDKLNILYLGDLLAKADKLEISDANSLGHAVDRQKAILSEVRSIEDQTSNKVISEQISKKIASFEKALPEWESLLTDEHVYYSNQWSTFYHYAPDAQVESRADAKSYCANQSAGNLNWSMLKGPEISRYSFAVLHKKLLGDNRYVSVVAERGKGQLQAKGRVRGYWFDKSNTPVSELKVVCIYQYKDFALTEL